MFIDEARIFVASGKGGDGIVHFRREKYVPFGGPDGGDGGRGGDVILEVMPVMNTLAVFQHKNRYKAQDGSRGGGNNKTGKSGQDLVIQVPPGTVVYQDDNGAILGDLTGAGERLIVCRGGRGGRGNARFATSRNQAPRTAERGEPGEELTLHLELRLIADIGIVGVPNAGKSTFLAAVTNARPKIAAYPFTTLEPNLGVSILDDQTSLVLADIPGLIEGAHLGIGLGHAFLRHIQRTRVLIHLLDGMADDPLIDFAQINSELALFDPALANKPQLVAYNKMDIPEVQVRWPEIEAKLIQRGYSPTPVSALTGSNLRLLLYRAARILSEAPPLQISQTVPRGEAGEVEMPVYRLDNDPRDFTIERVGAGVRVSGEAIERAAAMTYWEYDESVRRFQRILQTLGVEEGLRKAGVKAGDTVYIGEYELEWTD
jgi:GTP-binding protein